MDSVWIVVEIPDDGDGNTPEREAYSTETLAYAALGRWAVMGGALSGMSVQRYDILSAPPEGRSEVTPVVARRPEWLDETFPSGFRAGGNMLFSGAFDTFTVELPGTTADQDAEFVTYLAALLNGGRP